ncbi:pseudaminic acid biosynthesis-associated protein PseG [Thermobacillus composti KWC4]|uniref:Pseudaminic acid biosynthesis-associated protein PseG n=1 Tax=Thermobacillus composti (strain DSM 18247 / JCM 13945 / KWC4) TaxID=717605 RepID=L0E9U4_THECK|nr:pseudaminic acid biosynthesis-associated protein PseG [Thermobacillus composti KWC4]
MRIGFRADASSELGTGHLMRCRALARSLRRKGAEIAFFSGRLPEWLAGELRSDGFRYIRLDGAPDDPEPMKDALTREACGSYDWLVVDHYGWGERQESAVAPHVRHLMVIDDLANRRHVCDLLLDQNDVLHIHERYMKLVPASVRMLLGSRYALLRDEFSVARKSLRPRDGHVRTLFVCFGGTDPTNETAKALEALNADCFSELTIHLVVGRSHSRLDQIIRLCENDSRIRLHIQTNQVAKLMAESDLALTSGGTITWERYCMGLPGLVIAVADNQKEIAMSGHRSGVDWYLGESRDVSMDQVRTALLEAMSDPERLRMAQRAASERVDGCGADRVADIMLKADEWR